MYLVQEKTGGDVLSERHVCSASFREIDTHSPFYENLYGLASRSMVEHMIQVQPIRAFHLLNNRDWFRGVHMTQAWPMKTLQTLTTKTGSGDANPPWNFLEPSESLCSHFSRIPHLKIWNNLWAQYLSIYLLPSVRKTKGKWPSDSSYFVTKISWTWTRK